MIAIVISRVFDPVVLIPLMLGAAVIWSLINGLRWRFILLLLFIDGLIPFLYFVHLLSTKEISDWDTTLRQQRVRLYGFTVIVHAGGVLLALLLGKIILSKILLSFWFLAAIFFLVTLRWKISLHTGVAAAGATFLALLFGPQWLWLFVLVGLIGWARIKIKKHSPLQAAAGAILAGIILWGSFQLLHISSDQARAPSQPRTF